MHTTAAVPHPRRHEAGVTLVEVLVVLAIMGVMTGIAALAIPSGPRPATLRAAADLLAARLDIAAEESLISGRAARLEWDGTGYRFTERQGDDWAPHGNAALAGPHPADGIALRGETGGGSGVLTITPDLAPPDGTIVRVGLGRAGEVGAGPVAVVFDGASARVETR